MENIWMTTIVCFLAIIVIIAANDEAPDSMEALDKKTEEIITNKRPSFFVGSRYGRSYGNSKNIRVNVSPRNDRFFLGSRYGKRSNDYLSALESDQQETPAVLSASNRSSKFFTMSCVHTGFKNFFRCNAVNDIENFIHHLSNDEQ